MIVAARLLLVTTAAGCSSEIDLDGLWDFEADPDDVGVAQRWFDATAKPQLATRMGVPGAWQSFADGARGVGVETPLLWKQFSGVGWYRRLVDVSSKPDGTTCWLWLGGAPGGVMRKADVYSNSEHIGRHVGYLDPVEMQLPCDNLPNHTLSIVVAVDSRWNVTEDPLWGSGSWWQGNSNGCRPGAGKTPFFNFSAVCAGGDGYSYGGYGGIVGHSKVLFRQPLWVEDSVHVRSVPASAGSADWVSTISFAVVGSEATAPAELRATVEVCSWNDPLLPCTQATVTPKPPGERTEIGLVINDARLWWPGTPGAEIANLYTANVSLSTGTSRSIRYGVKQMVTAGSYKILINGQRLFLRGYGDDAMYATTAAPPTDRGFYRRTLQSMKDLGFNFIRFHTHNMPSEFFDVADELGMMSNPELAMNYHYPCELGIATPGAVCDPDNDLVREVFNRSMKSLVQRQSHRPSIFARVLANEIQFPSAGKNGRNGTVNNQFAQLYLISKEFDPERPVWFADGASTDLTPTGISNLKCQGANLTAKDDISCDLPPCPPGPKSNYKTCSPCPELPCPPCPVQRCYQDVLSWNPYAPLPDWTRSSGPDIWPWSAGGGLDRGSGLPTSLPVPVLMHETMDTRSFPRLEVNAETFSGSNIKGKELWYEESIDKMRLLGLLEENDAWSMASDGYRTELLKVTFENIHLDATGPGVVSGYELWLGFDWPPASNGVIGGHGNEPRPKPGMVNDTFRDVQRELMVLAKRPLELQTTGYAPGNNVNIELVLQNMTLGGFPSWLNTTPTMNWSVTMNGQTVATHSSPLAPGSIMQGDTGTLGNASFRVPHTAAYARLVVNATVQLERSWSNSWTLDVFPHAPVPALCDVPVVTDLAMLAAARLVCTNVVSSPPASGAFMYVGRSLNASMAAMLNKAGGFALLISPQGFPTGCQPGSGIGVIPAPVDVSVGLPWWMGGGWCGSLVYNNSLFSGTELAGHGLPFSFTKVNEGQAWILDNASKVASNIITHVRAIPADGVYQGASYASTIKDYAMVFEANLPGSEDEDMAGKTSAVRVLFSGLNLLNSTSGLPTSGPGQWTFDTMMRYGLRKASHVSWVRPHHSTRTSREFCAGVVSFCTTGKETSCRQRFGSTVAGPCDKDYTIVQPVTLTSTDVVGVTAIKLKLQAKIASELIPLLYNSVSGQPARLLANGSAVLLTPASQPTWTELALSEQLQPGLYFVGALYSASVTCFTTTAAIGSHVFARSPYTDGPKPGDKLSWSSRPHAIAAYVTIKDNTVESN